MKILIACEYSGRVRDAFIAKGHDAISCDLRPTEVLGPHYQGDVRDILGNGFDMLIGHPYCTFNTLAGIRWMYHPDDTHLPATERRRHPKYPNRMKDFQEGIAFFKALRDSGIPKIALENSKPHGLMTAEVGNYTQCVQPWMFGSPVTKGACWWLYGLPNLIPTHQKTDYQKITPACHFMSPGPNREKERSRTDVFLAKALAEQWG